MKILLFIFIANLLQIIRADSNAGVYVYAKKETVLLIKDKYWSDIYDIFKDISITIPKEDGVAINDLHLNILTEAADISVNTQEQGNFLSVGLKKLSAIGKTGYQFGVAPLNLTGNFNITINLKDTSLKVSAISEPRGTGLIPQIKIEELKANIQNDLNMNFIGTQLSVLTDQLNNDSLDLRPKVIDLLNKQLDSG